jgi:nitrite reductase/ring-hydroxylating ferredoxin subunit
MVTLCHIDDLAENGGRRFEFDGERLFAVRRRGAVYVYRNVCPHQGTPLDWKPNAFFDADGHFLKCSTHGALFEVTSGICIAGPCRGHALETVTWHLRDGRLSVSL